MRSYRGVNGAPVWFVKKIQYVTTCVIQTRKKYTYTHVTRAELPPTQTLCGPRTDRGEGGCRRGLEMFIAQNSDLIAHASYNNADISRREWRARDSWWNYVTAATFTYTESTCDNNMKVHKKPFFGRHGLLASEDWRAAWRVATLPKCDRSQDKDKGLPRGRPAGAMLLYMWMWSGLLEVSRSVEREACS